MDDFEIKCGRDIKLELDGLGASYLSGHVMDEDLDAEITKQWVSLESLHRLYRSRLPSQFCEELENIFEQHIKENKEK